MRRGFTILELLVSVAIIAMLTAVTMVLLTSVREKSRDAERMSELRQLRNALNIYVTQTGNFPVATDPVALSGEDIITSALISEDTIKAPAVDPRYPAYAYTYQSSADGSSFIVSFCLETNTIQGYNEGCNNFITP